MSYCRAPYIYSDGSKMYMNGIYVDEELINILLYDLHKPYREEELKERIEEGRKATEKYNKIMKEGLF